LNNFPIFPLNNFPIFPLNNFPIFPWKKEQFLHPTFRENVNLVKLGDFLAFVFKLISGISES